MSGENLGQKPVPQSSKDRVPKELLSPTRGSQYQRMRNKGSQIGSSDGVQKWCQLTSPSRDPWWLVGPRSIDTVCLLVKFNLDNFCEDWRISDWSWSIDLLWCACFTFVDSPFCCCLECWIVWGCSSNSLFSRMERFQSACLWGDPGSFILSRLVLIRFFVGLQMFLVHSFQIEIMDRFFFRYVHLWGILLLSLEKILTTYTTQVC